MRVRLPIVLFAVGAAFVSGLVSSSTRGSPWGLRDAHAQSAPFAASVYVPSDGLAFRTFDGRVVAKLAYDGHGGFFELYDEHEQPAGRVRGEARPAALATPLATPLAGPSQPSAQPQRARADLGF
jgi:hypothetical protein